MKHVFECDCLEFVPYALYIYISDCFMSHMGGTELFYPGLIEEYKYDHVIESDDDVRVRS